MTKLAILVKSHGPDLAYADRLLRSVEAFNVDLIPVFLVVPDADLEQFTPTLTSGTHLIPESSFASHLVSEPVNGYAPGYINQEIVKLSFWEMGLADNYLCVDSDAQFVRSFFVDDFMADTQTPYTFLTEDRELQADPTYFSGNWRPRMVALERIAEAIGLDERPLRTVHGHAVFSSRVLASFYRGFLTTRGWTYSDALAIAPYEPSWYNFWLQRDKTIPIVPREPLFKTFHSAHDQEAYALQGFAESDAARGYVGVIVNSNFSRGVGMASLSDGASMVLASHHTSGELLRVLAARRRT